MDINRLRGGIGTIAVISAMLFIVAAVDCAAQQNAVRLDDPSTGGGIVWWVVGSGGVLGAGGEQGELLSGTIGQTAIDRSDAQATQRADAASAYFGYWLPEPGSTSDIGPVGTGAGSHGAFALANLPNPFSSRTTIHYLLPAAGRARMRIFDMAGRQVRLLLDGDQDAGPHSLEWNGTDDAGGLLATGAYIYMLELTGNAADIQAPATTERGIMQLVR
jgi:hypothetical protein